MPQQLEPFTSQDNPALSHALKHGRLPFLEGQGRNTFITQLHHNNVITFIILSCSVVDGWWGGGASFRPLVGCHSGGYHGNVHWQHSPHLISPSTSSTTANHWYWSVDLTLMQWLGEIFVHSMYCIITISGEAFLYLNRFFLCCVISPGHMYYIVEGLGTKLLIKGDCSLAEYNNIIPYIHIAENFQGRKHSQSLWF